MGGRARQGSIKSLLGLPARLQNQYNVKNPACQYKCAVLAQIFLTAREMAQAPPQVQDTVISSWLWTFDFGGRWVETEPAHFHWKAPTSELFHNKSLVGCPTRKNIQPAPRALRGKTSPLQEGFGLTLSGQKS